MRKVSFENKRSLEDAELNVRNPCMHKLGAETLRLMKIRGFQALRISAKSIFYGRIEKHDGERMSRN